MASAASAGPPGGPPPPPGSLVRTPSDPSQVTPTASTLFSLIRRATTAEGGAEYYIVRLTAHGNAALRELCRTPEQREVWSWPSYEFLVKMKKDRTPAYTIGLAKATHLVNLSYDCLVPRRDAVPITAQCNVRNSNEPRYIPQASAPLPPLSRVKELTDSDEANDDNGAGGTATAV
ncbi:hypothetical protein N7447_010276 [Penicillium robsamsonii]|uniref:uncharacterized protein n=1 Tax=Penicillium robsamsonii TaxID=1792511 RepID=UPI00254827A0|nr:uncharacterized protein N7447_010276 [Penicillium robsamsonii]KAJ5810760.1 hypothetical protein N7447_010276 [Penicillium robsamsonii]